MELIFFFVDQHRIEVEVEAEAVAVAFWSLHPRLCSVLVEEMISSAGLLSTTRYLCRIKLLVLLKSHSDQDRVARTSAWHGSR